jgi:hypothetical protein
MDETPFAHGRILDLIKARFAGVDPVIERGYSEDSSFQSLCEDYRDCLATLERLRRDEAVGTAGRREEYAELLMELDGEIRDWLAAHDAG